jgi:hypothetical protein
MAIRAARAVARRDMCDYSRRSQTRKRSIVCKEMRCPLRYKVKFT